MTYSQLAWNLQENSSELTLVEIQIGRVYKEERQRTGRKTRTGWKESKEGKGGRRPQINNFTLCGHQLRVGPIDYKWWQLLHFLWGCSMFFPESCQDTFNSNSKGRWPTTESPLPLPVAPEFSLEGPFKHSTSLTLLNLWSHGPRQRRGKTQARSTPHPPPTHTQCWALRRHVRGNKPSLSRIYLSM